VTIVAYYDLVIKNAKIVDGNCNPWFWGDVAVKDGKIAFVGKLTGEIIAGKEIDAGGQVLAPGFIDIHAHHDFQLLRDPIMLSKIKQGVTTHMIGQCGISAAPIKPDKVELLDRYTGFARAGVDPEWNWQSFGEYLDILDGLDLAINVGGFVGHGTIRINVMGFESRKATTDELAEMRQLANDAMAEGAFGMTSGLIYPPGVYSDTEELSEICKGLKQYNGVYLSHMRNESNAVVEAVKETVYVVEKAGIPGQISHHKAMGKKNWGLVKDTLRTLEEARQRGIDMTVDQYPYTAASTTLRAILPSWVQEGGIGRVIQRLQDPDNRVKIIDEIKNTDDWENMFQHCGGPAGVMLVYTPKTPEFEGKNLLQAGEMTGKEPLEAALDIIIANEGSDTTCYFMMSEDDVKFIMKHPLVMIGSDSIPAAPGAKCHPRTNGTFPRVLGKYVREERTLRLEEAIWKMTGFPASRLKMHNKGLIKPGMDADLTIFNPDTVIDGANFEDPFKEPLGITYVIVNGVIVLHNNNYTGETAGKVIRRS
jgi:N-acyl-D-amino-acid deacylase